MAESGCSSSGTFNDLTINGNFKVTGTTTTVESTNTTIKDTIIELNSGATTNSNDCGILIERGSTGDNAFIGWDESADAFVLGTTTSEATATGNLVIDTAVLFKQVTDAVNEIQISNAATGDGPILEAQGDNTNIDLNLNAKGSGVVKFATNTDRTVALDFDGSAVNADTTLVISSTENRTITFPDAADTLVGRATTDTLTNKTLTTPTINAAALSGTLSGAPTFSGATTFTAGAQSSSVARTATANGSGTGTIAAGTSFVTVTSDDATKIIILPTPTVGNIIWLTVGGTGYELRTNAPNTVAINGGSGIDFESAIAANITIRMVCTSATTWIGTQFTAAGTESAVEVANNA